MYILEYTKNIPIKLKKPSKEGSYYNLFIYHIN
jgi:hypothetical protein